jgi:hypothetical protein
MFLAEKIAKSLPKSAALILKGNSLGGAIATKVARLCHAKGILAFLYNGRSFTSTSNVLAGYLQTLKLSGHYQTRITKSLANFMRPILAFILKIEDWEIEAAGDYKEIPEKYKCYYVIRSPKENRGKNKDDSIIPYISTFENDQQIKQTTKKLTGLWGARNMYQKSFYLLRRKCYPHMQKEAHSIAEVNLSCRKDPSLNVHQLFCLFAKYYVYAHRPRNDVAPTSQSLP